MTAMRKPTTKAAGAEWSAAMMEKLTTSCLDAGNARQLGMKVVPAASMKALGLPERVSFELPYFGLDGKPSGFKRYRYMEDTRDGFAALTTAKATRYVQPPGSLQEAYFPPLTDWAEIAENVDTIVAITEGELKAACCTKLAGPCIGLGGVWSFKSTKSRKPLLDAFFKFQWEGRMVVIAYDSDAATNPQVVKARSALANALVELGAAVYIVDVPPADDGGKQGLDDFAYAHGADALQSLLATGTEFEPSVVLHGLNEEIAYIRDPGIVMVYKTNQKMRPADFVSHHYANRHIVEYAENKDGDVREKKTPASRAWLEWPGRGEFARFTFKPGEDVRSPYGEYNTWPGWGCEPKKGSVEPWRKLLDHLFKGHPESRQWLERWLALPLQRPGSKMYTSAVVWGVKTGTGKSLIGYTMKRIYGKTFTEIGDSELQDQRKEWAVDKCFVLGDDVTGHEQRNLSDRLKKMITQETMRVDVKYIPSYEVPDYINYYFTSNHPDAFFLEDDDRRMFVHEVTASPLPQAFYDEYKEWLDNGGGAALFHHLLSLDLGDMKASGRAPKTDAKLQMAEDGMSDMARWVRRLKSDPDIVLKFGDAVLTGDLWSGADLMRIYDPEGRSRVTAGTLTKELKRAGFERVYNGMQVATKLGQLRLFAVRNQAKWIEGPRMPMKTFSEHYDTTRTKMERPKKF